MTLNEAREMALKLTFDKDLVNEIANLILGCVWTERNECARVARDHDAPRIEQLILERNRAET